MLITAPLLSQVNAVKQSIIDKWKIEDNSPAKEFLKIKITRDRKNWTLDLDQHAYIMDIINGWIVPKQKTWTPMTTTPIKAPTGSHINTNTKHNYPTLVEKLLWISNTVHPNICYAVNNLARHMSNPTTKAMQVVLCVVKYLNQTKDEVSHIRGKEVGEATIETYTNANWAFNPNTDQNSTSWSVVKVFSSTVTWNSHVQKCVASSAVEAEYIASSAATREALFHWHLLHSLGFNNNMPTIFTDNTGCVQVANDPVRHSNLKHIDTKYHLIHDHVQEGNISIKYVQTDDNITNFLTKLVTQDLLACMRDWLGMVNVGPLNCSAGEGDS